MALATRCPHCSTVFKVANDQLKLRGGLVRCGVCQQVFNGVEGLVKSDQPAPPDAASGASGASADAVVPRPSTPASTPSSPHGRPGASVPHGGSLLVRPAANDAPVASPKQVAPSHAPLADTSHSQLPGDSRMPSESGTTSAGTTRRDPLRPQDEAPPAAGKEVAQPAPDPMLRMTLLDIAQAGPHPSQHPIPAPGPGSATPAGQDGSDPTAAPASDTNPDPLAAAIDELNARPVTGSLPPTKQDEEDRAIDPDLPEPSFLSTSRPARPATFWKTGVVLLAVLLALQFIYFARHHIADAVPQTGAFIEGLCVLLRCDAGLPAEIDAVNIESSELQQAPGGQPVFTLSFSLQNTSGTAQSWPHVELTLNDTAEQPVVRRVFTPEEYVTSHARREQGLARQSSASFRLTFELSQPKAAGYRIYVFYP